ncbi:Serine/arginine repetitive matrix protein 2 [Ptychographa xylographoides]|nr:Serine/arginine repetitive matrix protein 2 [Ptychographa xylographoides]
MGLVRDFFSLTVYVPLKAELSRAEIGECMTEDRFLVAPTVTPLPSPAAEKEKRDPPAPAKFRNASAQTEYFWFSHSLNLTSNGKPLASPNLESKATTEKIVAASVSDKVKTPKQLQSHQGKHTKTAQAISQRQSTANLAQNSSKCSSNDKHAYSKHPNYQSAIKKQDFKLRPRDQPKKVAFAHPPQFIGPNADSSDFSESSASDESNVDPEFAAPLTYQLPRGYVSLWTEPELHNTQDRTMQPQGHRQEYDTFVGNDADLRRRNKIAARHADKDAARHSISGKEAANERAASDWLEARNRSRDAKIREAQLQNDDETARAIDKQRAKEWMKWRSRRRYCLLNQSHHPTERDRYKEQVARRADQQKGIEWMKSRAVRRDQLRDRKYSSSPTDWNSRSSSPDDRASRSPSLDVHRSIERDERVLSSQPRKSSLAKAKSHSYDISLPRQRKRVSFSPEPQSYKRSRQQSPDQHDQRDKWESDSSSNESEYHHIPPYRRPGTTGGGTLRSNSAYAPHSGRKSSYENLPDPIFIWHPRTKARKEDREREERTITTKKLVPSRRTALREVHDNGQSVREARKYMMSGALDDRDARTRAYNAPKRRYEPPRAEDWDATKEDDFSRLQWD